MLELAAHSAHLWCLDLELEPRAIASLKDHHVNWLTDQERRRFRRLQLPRRRQHYLLGKVFTREVLSRYDDIAPGDWRFTENQHGKPAIAGADLALHFNLSHSRERFVLAVSRVAATGVDVECCARQRRVSRLAQRYFTAAESAWLLSLPVAQQQDGFYQLWTLKEAYMKARGKGQALALDAFGFDLSVPGRIVCRPDSEALAESAVAPADWRCWRLADPLSGLMPGASAGEPGSDESNRYALSLVLGQAAPFSLSAFRYAVAGEHQQLDLAILAEGQGQGQGQGKRQGQVPQ